MNEIQLKPCPFCGARPFIFRESVIGFSTHVKKVFYEVECTECFAKIDGWFDSEQEAAEVWNKRAEQPTLYGYNIEHLELIARILQKEDLPPERIVEVLTDIGGIVAIAMDEFEEALRKAVEP